MTTNALYLSREQVREVDRTAIEQYHISGPVLMENAGRNAAHLLEELGIDGSVLICVGKGNNGGDGFVIARHLEFSGYAVKLLLFCDPEKLQGDAKLNYEICLAARIPISLYPQSTFNNDELESIQTEVQKADWVVDALLGTGTQGEVREPFSSLIAMLNQHAKQILAIDLPSGLDCDTGKPLGDCVQATHTATFVALKLGFKNSTSTQYTGKVTVLPIGIAFRQYKQLLAEKATEC